MTDFGLFTPNGVTRMPLFDKGEAKLALSNGMDRQQLEQSFIKKGDTPYSAKIKANRIFMAKAPSPTLKDVAMYAPENAMAGVSGLVSTPVSGLSGLLGLLTGADNPAQIVSDIQSAMTYQPTNKISQEQAKMVGLAVDDLSQKTGFDLSPILPLLDAVDLMPSGYSTLKGGIKQRVDKQSGIVGGSGDDLIKSFDDKVAAADLSYSNKIDDGFDDKGDVYGVRVIPKGYSVKPGDELDYSYVWDDGNKTAEQLPGVSTLNTEKGIKEAVKMAIKQGYYGNQIVVVKGRFAEYGEDPGEIVIANPIVDHVISDDLLAYKSEKSKGGGK